MGRMIDGDALTKRLIEFCNKNCPYTAKARDIMCGSCFMGLALEAVEDAPIIDSEQRWVPVNERLPKQGQEVICQCRANIIKVLKLDADGDWDQDAEHCYMGGFVIAWMPLPEPWKEGEK